MSAEDTVQIEFYSIWPDLGKKLSEQLGEIRTDTASLAPVVRAVGLDASGNFSNLDGVAAAAVQAYEIGQQDFHNKFRTHYNKTSDVFEIAYNTGTSQTPNWYLIWNIDSGGSVTQTTSPTTASNVGSGKQFFKQKVGVDLEFRTLTATGVLTAVQNTNTVDLTSSAEANTYSSDQAAAPSGDAGVGVEIILSDTGKTGVNLPFKAIKAGPNVVVSNTGTAIQIESTAQVVEFYGIAVGHSDNSQSYIEVHNLLFNRENFYITQQTTNPSNKTVIINSIGDVLNSNDFVHVIGDDMTGQLAMHNGTTSEPSIGFTSDTNTGIRRRAEDDLALVSGGSDVARALTDRFLTMFPLQVTNTGSAASPDIFWNPDSDTGLYQVVANDDSIAFATAGAYAGHFDSSQILNVNTIRSGDGSAAAPAYSWTAAGENDVGMYRAGTNSIGFSTAGAVRVTIGPSTFESNLVYRGPAGSATTPTYAFAVVGETDNGMYKAATDTLGFTTQGTNRLSISTTAINPILPVRGTDGTVGAPSYSFSATGQTDVGMYRKTTDQLAFTTGGVLAGFFNASQDLVVTNDVHVADEVYSSSWDGALTVPTKNALFDKIETLAAAVDILPGFYGMTVKHHDDTFAQRGVNVIGVNTEHFYLSGNGDEVTINARADWVDKTGDTMTGSLTSVLFRADPGSISAPAYAFSDAGQTDVGMYKPAADTLGFVTNGVARITIDTTAIIPNLSIRTVFGVAATPAYSFKSGQGNLGMFRKTTNELGFATSGVLAGYFDANQDFFVTNDAHVADEAYGSSWDGALTVPTKNALYDKIETLGQLFYLTVKHHDDTFAQRGVNVIGVNTEHFYLSGNGDEVTINSRDVWVDKAGDTMTGSLTIGTGADNDSTVEFYDDGDLAYTLGWDASASAFKLADGLFDDTNDQIVVTSNQIDVYSSFYVHGDLQAEKVHANYGNFYTRLTLNQRPMKFASDGILYAWDLARGKYLSVSRETVQYSRDSVHTTAVVLGFGGTVLDNNIRTAYLPHRNFTITSVSAWAREVTVAPMDINVSTLGTAEADSAILTVQLPVVAAGAKTAIISDPLNIDVDVNPSEGVYRGIMAILAPTGGASINDPCLQVEIAYRLD